MDEIDRAQEHAEAMLRFDLQFALEKCKNHAESYLLCADCEEEIPEQRRNAAKGCTRCFDCQEINEKINKGKTE